MIERLKALLGGKTAAPAGADSGLRLATAALLLEAAVMDGTVDDTERDVISSVLQKQFGISPHEAAVLTEEARVSLDAAGDLYAFTRTVKDGYQPERRVEIIEMLWRVAYADGVVHDYEANLVRRVAGLLYVPDQVSGDARKRIMAELSISGV